ncbi:YgfZ/GcvT domain-containing protein [Rhizobium tumorigenes]|uniref:CAF17-like 4Fe-4S cluster assembly/insertion protein YgfZ n=1 Tax=Rhizobium tumorigenes TaxID=2041385 RepID=UPI00241E44A8|nr:folate-binding protein YgfZ [Rhizobium tumorigenes]WFS01831.1 folate-binding protein YgfZ [Rhizobium tumorigenes]
MPAVFLNDRSLLRITGADAESFLQNLITTDLGALAAGEARPGALLTPQGKIMFDFMIWRNGDGFVVETDSVQGEALLKRLSMYRLRAAVEITASDDQGVTVSWGDADNGGYADSRFAKARMALHRVPGAQGEGPVAIYDAARIAAGVPSSGIDFSLQDAFPHDVLMDLNGGLSFRKGCYVGQEVVSRMQHRGTARKRLVLVSADSDLPETGTPLLAGGKPIGTLGSVSANRGLAIVRIDRAGEAMASDTPILAGELPVSLALPAWSGLSFPSKADEATA